MCFVLVVATLTRGFFAGRLVAGEPPGEIQAWQQQPLAARAGNLLCAQGLDGCAVVASGNFVSHELS